MASISFKKREKLYLLVEGALALPGAYATEEEAGVPGTLSQGVRTALTYISNAAKDVKVPLS